jgi:vacuolar-type H+-ATPase subunit I/STV1
MLLQLQAIGNLRLEAEVHLAIQHEEKRTRHLRRQDPGIARHWTTEMESRRLEQLRQRHAVERDFETDRTRKLTIKEMMRQQAEVEQKRLALQKASTLVECLQALKSYDLDDLGLGHPQGGDKNHLASRMQVMERIRSRAAPLPPILQND